MSKLLQKGAYNVIVTCLGVKKGDKVVIIGDKYSRETDQAILSEAKKMAESALLLNLEDYGKRPFKEFSPKIKKDITDFNPTVSVYAAQSQEGELVAFRSKLMSYLIYDLRCRHGHMPGITIGVMEDGMATDYNEIYAVSMKVFDYVRPAKEIRITTPNGTDFTSQFDKKIKWVPSHGRYHKKGQWGNLPEGEVFTSPINVNGIVICEILGDYFSAKYGLLKDYVSIHIKNGYVWDVVCKNKVLEKDVKQYLYTSELCNRVGEFSIGTNIGLKKLVGVFLQDEKFPGFHIAFGHPYPKETGVKWDAARHLDVLATKATIVADGKKLMDNGKFVFEK